MNKAVWNRKGSAHYNAMHCVCQFFFKEIEYSCLPKYALN